jgi:SAM-dependent methyltransferase
MAMDDGRMIELLIELHDGLERLGPGDDAATLRALALCVPRPSAPRILDIGCGSGAQSLLLADATDGHVTATDLAPAFLARLGALAEERGLGDRIATCAADMGRLPFAEGAFDFVWSEGAIYLVGFDEGLVRWRPLLRSGGWLVVSEMSWLQPDPPAELSAFWSENYPAMRDVESNLAAARDHGWVPVGHFRLPAEGWEAYYGPLRARLSAFIRAHEADPEAAAVVAATEHEMALMTRHLEMCGYVFYVLCRATR